MFPVRAVKVVCFAFITAVGIRRTFVARGNCALSILASLPLPLTVVSAQQCYTTSTTCTSTNFTIPSTRPAGPYACCVNGGGVSYKLSTNGPCTACVGKCCLLRVRSLPPGSASVPLPRQYTGSFLTRPPHPYLSQAFLTEKDPCSTCTLDT